MTENSRINVNVNLLENLQKHYPETKRMTYTGLVDWALRLLIKNAKEAS